MGVGLVVIGTSLGGLHALEIVLRGLGKSFPVPIAVAQHRGKIDGRLASLLQSHTPLTVKDAEDKDPLTPSTVFVAPADYHLLIDGQTCALSLEAPICFARPSVDVLFESAADSFGRNAIGIILTGSSRDGAAGAARIKAAGGMVAVQDPQECEGPEMPQATLDNTAVDRVLKLEDIAPFLLDCCSKTGRVAR